MNLEDRSDSRLREVVHTGCSGEQREPSLRGADVDEGLQGDVPPAAQVYEMPLSRLIEAVKRIERANRRLERAGILERFTIEREDYVHIPDGEVVGVSAVRVTLNTPRLSLSGWSFTAAHEMTADGQIINYGPARVDEMRCDHCGHARRRGKVYTVTNESGDLKVVGSNCMGAFLGVKPEGLWTLTFDLEDSDSDDEDRWATSTGDVTVPAIDLVGAALAASNDGVEFVPKSRATLETPSTASKVEKDLRSMVAAGEEPERRAYAVKILAWVNEQPEGGDGYIDNLRAVLAGEDRWVSRKHFGIGVSAVTAYRNALEWAARDEQKRDAAESLYEQGHVGAVGERFRELPMTLMLMKVHPGDLYGPTTRMVFREDSTGRQVLWWASGNRTDDWHEGDRVQLTATVKEHGHFDGVTQTIVSRGKLAPVE